MISYMSFGLNNIKSLHLQLLGDAKLAAIGIKVSKWIAYHGLALNVTTDLQPFDQIIPCGIRDRQVGSIKGLLNENGRPVEDYDLNDDQDLMDTTCRSIVREFCDVFQIDLCQKTSQRPATGNLLA